LLSIAKPPTPEEIQDPNSAGWKAFNSLRTGVGACIQQGKFRATDPDAVSQAIWAAIHGITSLLIGKPFFPWVNKDRVIDLVIDSMLEGLKK